MKPLALFDLRLINFEKSRDDKQFVQKLQAAYPAAVTREDVSLIPNPITNVAPPTVCRA